MQKDLKLRGVFDEIAELYDAIRPKYPEELFDVLIEKAELKENSNILEIAPGTGRATFPLAKKGFYITGVELGAQFAKFARKNLSRYPKVKIITGAFEDIEFPIESFDLVYVATAFHWIEPEVKFIKTHQLLRAEGCLAVIGSSYISDEKGDLFYYASQPLYDKYFPKPKKPFRVQKLEKLRPAELDTDLFELIHFQCFPRVISYTAEEYCQLMNTNSDTLALPQEKREKFLEEIKDLINKQFKGVVERRYANSLTIAKKKKKGKI